MLLGYTFSGASAPLVSETKLNVWKEQADALQDVAALRVRRVSLADGAEADQVLALQANVDLFTLIGARAALGRVFTADEDRPAGDRVVILADGFWKRRFGADPRVVGRQLRLDGEMTTVVGVLNSQRRYGRLQRDPGRLDPLATGCEQHLPSALVDRRRPAQARCNHCGCPGRGARLG